MNSQRNNLLVLIFIKQKHILQKPIKSYKYKLSKIYIRIHPNTKLLYTSFFNKYFRFCLFCINWRELEWNQLKIQGGYQ